MPIMKTEKVSVSFTPAQKERIEKFAEKADLTISSFIRYVTVSYMDAMEKYKKRDGEEK